jgi:hypothetical protein
MWPKGWVENFILNAFLIIFLLIDALSTFQKPSFYLLHLVQKKIMFKFDFILIITMVGICSMFIYAKENLFKSMNNPWQKSIL